MSQKPNFLKTAIRRSNPGKQVNFLTVRANCDFERSYQARDARLRWNPLVSRRLGLAYHICGGPLGWWCGGRCVRPGCRSGCGCSWREGCPARWRWCGGRCVPWCRSVCGCSWRESCLDRDGCAHLPRLKRSARVGLCASLTPYTHIYNRQKQIILMQKQKILCFYLVI